METLAARNGGFKAAPWSTRPDTLRNHSLPRGSRPAKRCLYYSSVCYARTSSYYPSIIHTQKQCSPFAQADGPVPPKACPPESIVHRLPRNCRASPPLTTHTNSTPLNVHELSPPPSWPHPCSPPPRASHPSLHPSFPHYSCPRAHPPSPRWQPRQQQPQPDHP